MLTHVVTHPGGSEPLPTVVALHGHGAHAQDLIGLSPHLAGGRALWICPQAEFPLEPGYYGFTWFRRDPTSGQRAADEPDRTLGVVGALLEAAQQSLMHWPRDTDPGGVPSEMREIWRALG